MCLCVFSSGYRTERSTNRTTKKKLENWLLFLGWLRCSILQAANCASQRVARSMPSLGGCVGFKFLELLMQAVAFLVVLLFLFLVVVVEFFLFSRKTLQCNF
jgi:hypothetical protein